MSRRRLLALAGLLVVAGIAVSQAFSHSHAESARGIQADSSCPYIYIYAIPPNALGFDTRYGQCAPIDDKLPFSLSYTWLRCDLAGKRCMRIRGLRGQEIVLPREPSLYTIRGAVTTTNSRGSLTDVTRDFYHVRAGVPRKATGNPPNSK